MDNTAFRASAQQWISGFDNQARRAIAGWRQGGDRLGQAARTRWDQAFEQSRPQLSEETCRNASHFRDVVSRYYVQGIDLSAGGAERAVTAAVQAAQVAVERTAGWRSGRA